MNSIKLLHSRAPETPEVLCDPEQLKQVLLNLVINAIEASPFGSEILLRAQKEARMTVIDVEDGGKGISEDASDRIFDPFFTTKTNGTGLGFAISSTIVSQHGGTLSFHKNGRAGTTFRIELPENQRHADVQ